MIPLEQIWWLERRYGIDYSKTDYQGYDLTLIHISDSSGPYLEDDYHETNIIDCSAQLTLLVSLPVCKSADIGR